MTIPEYLQYQMEDHYLRKWVFLDVFDRWFQVDSVTVEHSDSSDHRIEVTLRGKPDCQITFTQFAQMPEPFFNGPKYPRP